MTQLLHEELDTPKASSFLQAVVVVPVPYDCNYNPRIKYISTTSVPERWVAAKTILNLTTRLSKEMLP